MPEINEGSGDAYEAKVITSDNVASVSEVLDQENPRDAAEALVASAKAKVEKQKEHLAGAEASVEAAEAALAAL